MEIDRETSLPQARTPEELLARVREFLRHKEEDRKPSVADQEIDLISGQNLLDGWYDPERFENGTIRWTTRRFGFRATVEKATHVLLDACLFEESGFNALRARLAVDGMPGGAFQLRPGWNEALLSLPAGISGLVQVTIDVGGSWCPASLGTSVDERELAVAVRRLRLVQMSDLVPAPAAEESSRDLLAGLTGPRRRSGLLVRVLRRLRRLAIGWDLYQRISTVDQLAARLVRLEERLAMEERSSRELAKLIGILARADAEDRKDAVEMQEDLRADVSRHLAISDPTRR